MAADPEPAASQLAIAPEPVTLQALLAGFVAQMQYIFFNQAPTITLPTKAPTGQGAVSGTIAATSGNGQALTYTVVEQPKYGSVVLDAHTGAYTYTPMDVLVTPGITDSFTVSVDNGAALRLSGLAGFVQQALHSVAQGLRLAGSDTAAARVAITATGTGLYGDSTDSKYWQQQSYGDCQMMATAAVIGQLTGDLPTENSILTTASQIRSVVHTGYIWDFANPDSGTNAEDAVTLLKKYGITGVLTEFSDAEATFANGVLQLEGLKAALAQDKAVMTMVNANTLWAASNFGSDGSSFTDPNHAIVVIAVDANNGMVTVNDSGPNIGAGLQVPMGAFLWGWQSTGFQMIVAQRDEPVNTADAAANYVLAA
ncbi:C39 family peptidase [Mycolicibacterium sp. 050158]|uniref:C39 family peptidase n=1 Tax=Mycolicibacterium sp. 050158 TaxID=3090602 RepID=UPI00299F16BB|nr:C39 family peptidase [Mycolicibacterium sp. 050158]MDX1889308.1 C39 family peptidase [Mycolicibacterium sp. 050158]